MIASPNYVVPKARHYIQYHEQVDQFKQKIAENEKKMDEWNRGNTIINSPRYVQCIEF